MLRQTIMIGAAIALGVGCQNMNHKDHKAATTQPMAKACGTETCETAAAPAPEVATENLAGAWSLAMPRQSVQQATVEKIDDAHVKITAGKLSGTYAVQGKYLLIVTHDEKLRPTAWKMNTPDSLTVVRSPELGDGADYMGVTLVRAAGDETVSSESWDSDGAGQ